MASLDVAVAAMALVTVPVSDAQLRVLGALLRFHADTGAVGSPTLDELAWLAGRSRSTVYEHLHALRRAGLVDWEPGRRGTLRALVESVNVCS